MLCTYWTFWAHAKIESRVRHVYRTLPVRLFVCVWWIRERVRVRACMCGPRYLYGCLISILRTYSTPLVDSTQVLYGDTLLLALQEPNGPLCHHAMLFIIMADDGRRTVPYTHTPHYLLCGGTWNESESITADISHAALPAHMFPITKTAPDI